MHCRCLDADKRMVKVVSLAGLSCEGLASETMVKAQNASSHISLLVLIRESAIIAHT